MKFKLMNIKIFASTLVCLGILMLATNISNAQEETDQVISAHSHFFKSFLTSDSILFFSQHPSDFILIRSNGHKYNRNQIWRSYKVN